MAYEPQTWVLGLAGGTALNATRLNHMETGIDEAHSLIADLASATHTHVSADITDATASNVVDTVVKRDGTGFIAVSGITGLSTATGSTQAVPKSQLDAAIADLAGTAHTHVVADITNMTATGSALATAATATAARATLGVASTTEVTTEVDAAQAAAESYADSAVAASAATLNTTIDTAIDYAPIDLTFDVGDIPLRPDTSGTNRKVWWTGPAAAALPTTGTAAGGTAAAAPGDRILEF